MKPKIIINEEWAEAIIDADCNFDRFYFVAGVLQSNFNIIFTNKLNDLDSCYWDFEYKMSKLTLHFNVFVGIRIFPIAFKEATSFENDCVIEISTLLLQCLENIES